MKRLNFAPGETFEKWTVIEEGVPDKTGNRQWKCRCKCGGVYMVRGSWLRRGESKQCGRCSRKENPKIRLRPYEALFNQAKKWALRDNQIWQLQYEEFFDLSRHQVCHYCLAPVFFAKYCTGKNGRKYNLDRMDNNVGYVFGNVVVCCTRCNYAKGARYTYEEWYNMTDYFRKKAVLMD